MNPVFFEFGGFQIKWYSILLLVGVGLGILLFMSEGKKHGYKSDFLFNLCFWTVIFAFLGARFYYVLFNWNIYAKDPISIFKIWEGGLAIHGGIIGGFLTILYYCHKYHVKMTKIIDYVVPSILLGQAIGRWGNYFNQEAHGGVVSKSVLQSYHLPDFVIEGMNINGVYYHPTFFYESMWCLIGLIIVLLIRHYKYLKSGTLACFYLIWYSIGRFFIESMRTDSLMLGGFKVAQLVSCILFLVGLFGIMILSRKGKFEDLYSEPIREDIRY